MADCLSQVEVGKSLQKTRNHQVDGYCALLSLVVTHVHCGQTVHPRSIVTMEH